jgi:hypothetical protein
MGTIGSELHETGPAEIESAGSAASVACAARMIQGQLPAAFAILGPLVAAP